MSRVLVVYATTEGHTASIAERISTVMQGEGCAVEVLDAKDLRKQRLSADFDAIIVGGSVHAGDYQSSLREFVKLNRDLLQRSSSSFFSVSLSAADPDEESMIETKANLDKFFDETGWRPQRIEMFAGALVYTQYNLFIRHIMKLIVKQHGRPELDTSHDFDLTDWDAVERFARDIAQGVTTAVGAHV